MEQLINLLFMWLASNAYYTTPRIKRDGDFRDLVTQSTVFADKSLLIKDIIEDDDTTLLLAMPRRWGKTVNLDMLRRFLERPMNSNGEMRDRDSTDNYKLFAGGQVDGGIRGELELHPLKIAEATLFNATKALEVQGTCPVIYIDFKNCKPYESRASSVYNEIVRDVRMELGRCFEQHAYLKDSPKINERQRALLDKYLNGSEGVQLKRGLLLLSEALHAHHEKKVWILVDEYDAVANCAYREFNKKDLKDTIDLFASIYETALKSNPCLEKGVLTGVQYIAQSGMLSGLNNLGKFDFTSAKYAQHYGFDQAEVDHFFNHFEVPQNLKFQAKLWYNGYKAPKYNEVALVASSEFVSKYNVWSIVSYLKKKEFNKFKSHWEESGNIAFMKPLFKQTLVRDAIEKLVGGGDIFLDRKADFSVEDFEQLKAMLGGNKKITQDGLTVLLSYLFTGGYLTLAGTAENRYCLPNREITYEMERRLIMYYTTIYTIDPEKIQQVTDTLQQMLEVDGPNQDFFPALLSNFYDRFQEVIRDIRLVTDEHQEGVFTNEDIVHSILNYIALQTQHTTMGSELCTQKLNADKKGRVDLKVTKGNIGAIIEVKCVPTQEGATQHMEEALEQAKGYCNVLDTTNNIFLAINMVRQTSSSEQRSIELLCTAELFGEDRTLGIDASGEQYTSKSRRIG